MLRLQQDLPSNRIGLLLGCSSPLEFGNRSCSMHGGLRHVSACLLAYHGKLSANFRLRSVTYERIALCRLNFLSGLVQSVTLLHNRATVLVQCCAQVARMMLCAGCMIACFQKLEKVMLFRSLEILNACRFALGFVSKLSTDVHFQ